MAAMLDQVLSSGTGLLLIVLVARNADAATLGALSVALLINGFFLGVVRGGVCEVVLLRCRARPSRVAANLRNGLFLAIGAGLIVAVVLLGAGAVLGGELGAFVSVVAVAAPFVYSQDLLRYVAYGRGRIDQAIALDGMWFGVQLVVSVALVATGGATPVRLAVAWAAGAAVAAVAACLLRHVRPSREILRDWWGEERARAAGFVGDFLVSTGMVQLSFLLLGAVLPLAEFAALRVAFVALIPLANLLAGVRTLTLAHLAGMRSSPTRALRRAVQIGLAFAASGAVYGAVLVLIPQEWGAEAFGDTWREASTLVGIVAIGEALRLSTFAAIDFVKVFSSPLGLVRTRVVASAGVVAGLVLGALAAGPDGAATCVAIGYAVATLLWWHQARRVAADPQQVPVDLSWPAEFGNELPETDTEQL